MFLILPACGVAKNPTLCMSPIGDGCPFYAFISVITEVDSSYQLCFRCVCLWAYTVPACSSLTAGVAGSVPAPLLTQGHQGPPG